MSGGNQRFYVPIAPKPPALPTSGQLSTSSVTGTAWSMSEINAPPTDLPTLSIPCAQPQSTPPVQKCYDMVLQTPLLPPTGVSVTVQDPSSASSIVSLTETSSLYSSGNIISQTQSLSTLVTQTSSTTSLYCSGNMVPHSQSDQSQVSTVTHTPLTPAIHSFGNVLASPLNTSSSLHQEGRYSTSVADASSEQPILETSSQASSLGPACSLDEILSQLDCILDEPRTTEDFMNLSRELHVTVNEPDSPALNDWMKNFDITPLELLEDSIESGTHVQVIMDISFYKRIL